MKLREAYWVVLLIYLLIFDDAYIVKKGVCLCGPWIRVGKVAEWGKVGEKTVSNHLFSFL